MNTPEDDGARPTATVAVVLVTGCWSGPAKPAATVLRELSRRWGMSVHAVVLESAEDDVLDLLQVEMVPTWLRFVHGTDPGADAASALLVHDLSGATVTGEQITLPGPWILTHRRTGALPKHVVAAEFGPSTAVVHNKVFSRSIAR